MISLIIKNKKEDNHFMPGWFIVFGKIMALHLRSPEHTPQLHIHSPILQENKYKHNTGDFLFTTLLLQ